jgi:hypothetical protein
MREWIHDMLYDERGRGYFAKDESPVGPLAEPLALRQLADRDAYLACVAEQYAALGNKWLTPSEIFSPWMGRSIASFIASSQPNGRQGYRRIIEVGSGSGTLAKDICDFLKPLYGNAFSYTSIDISKALSETQRARLDAAGHGDVYEARHADATQESTWRGLVPDDSPTLILGMEVLDNLPHDKLVRDGNGVWNETVVVQTEEGLREALRPVTDDVPILRTLDAYERLSQPSVRDRMFQWLLDATGTPDPVWLPTGCFQLLSHIAHHVPNHEILLADFDFLPDVVIPGENAPIVSSTVEGKARDRGELLSAPRGSVDIFFPTNFALLEAMYTGFLDLGGHQQQQHHQQQQQRITREGRFQKASSFFHAHLPEQDRDASTTQDGFCPLIADYENTSFAHLRSIQSD